MAKHKPIPQMTAAELKNKIKSHMKTAFRYGIATKRLCDVYNQRVFAATKIRKKAAVVMLMETGDQCTFSGAGGIYDKFQKTGVVDGYTGSVTEAVKFSDRNAEAAPIRVMSFAETYKGTGYKASRNIVYDPNEDGVSEADESVSEDDNQEVAEISPERTTSHDISTATTGKGKEKKKSRIAKEVQSKARNEVPMRKSHERESLPSGKLERMKCKVTSAGVGKGKKKCTNPQADNAQIFSENPDVPAAWQISEASRKVPQAHSVESPHGNLSSTETNVAPPTPPLDLSLSILES